jgi:NTP pyrophosphatase (non-canonical NTP hydrolase)
MLGWIEHNLKSAQRAIKELQSTGAIPTSEPPPSFDQLVEKIRHWGDERLITKNSTPHAQLLKCMSELGELSDATLKNDREKIVDGVGDVIVTLIMYAATRGVCPRMCLEIAYDAIKDRKGYLTSEGVFVKEE